MKQILCHVCGSGDIREHEGYRRLKRVTSDCKPWDAGGGLCTCKGCGCTQAICDDDWRQSIESIYDNYTIYYQGGGEEQKAFDPATGRSLPRSEWLLKRIAQHAQLPANGRALDVGCGNGQFLKAFGAAYPGWRLSGTEFDGKYRAIVEALPGVEKLHTEPLSDLPVGFDLISLIHVLEHIENPISFLRELRAKLLADGLLFVELPSYESNPFELLIVDHATHYSLERARWVMGQAGFSALVSSDAWVSKEISLLGHLGKFGSFALNDFPDGAEAAISWLQFVAQEAHRARSEAGSFGIFGTSIAATWLTAELGSSPDFFVDEDINRIGRTHLGSPICAPWEVPPDSVVFVAQPEPVARRICDRLAGSTVIYRFCEVSLPNHKPHAEIVSVGILSH